jgi:superfamily I DNA/RNA helicase
MQPASLLIEAGPGSGKTTTVSWITSYIRSTNKSAWYNQHRKITPEQQAILDWVDEYILANFQSSPGFPGTTPSMAGATYNKEAAEHLNNKTHATCECRSIHGWGYKVLMKHCNAGYIPVNDGMMYSIVEKLTGKEFNKLPDSYAWRVAIRFFEKLKEELLDPNDDNLIKLAQKYEDLAQFKWDATTCQRIIKLLPEAKRPDKKRGIQWVDQVWLSCFLLKEPWFDLLVVDECQDISASRRLLCNKLGKHKIWVGDRYQAINAFAGADANSIDRIEELVTHVLPLKTSFRCPPAVITKLNARRPAANLTGLDKPDGEEARITLEEYPEYIKERPGSLTLCRTNAPLIKAAYTLLEASIPCRILGDRAVDQLATIVTRQKASSIPELERKLDKYENTVCQGLEDYVAELFKDKINCIRIVLPYCSSPEDVVKELKRLFKPSGKDAATLCTIHKGKGLESANVFILFPPIASPHARTQEQKEQELNLEHVAESRTSLNTYWVV